MISIYIGNHGKRDGIEDYITLITQIFTSRGHTIKVSEALDENAVNIVIDEFTNFVRNQEILEFRKKHPNVKLIYVLTEFIEKRLFVRSFNFFGGLLDAAAIAAMNVYMRWLRKDFLPASFRDWFVAIAYLPLLPFCYLMYLTQNLKLKKLRKFSISRCLHSLAYLQMRYLGLEKMIGVADGVILSHGLISDGLGEISPKIKVIGVMHPEVDWDDIKKYVFLDKGLSIEMTGSITPYRKKIVNRMDKEILSHGLNNSFGRCKVISFGSKKGKDVVRGAYSLHPPQTAGWKYSSPTRIFRALQHDHNLPVMPKLFNQHPIEKLCLELHGSETLIQMFKFYKNREELLSWLEPRVVEYMDIAKKSNDAIIEAISG